MTHSFSDEELVRIKSRLAELAYGLGFGQLGVAGVDLAEDEARLERWLAEGRHGEMRFMARHGRRRSRPAELIRTAIRHKLILLDP